MSPEQAQALGTFISEARQARGLSARRLATAADVDVTTITRIEAGAFLGSSPERLRRIAGALEVPATELLTLAGYVSSADLPTPKPYLRAKYPDLPPAAVERAERYLIRLMREHGVDAAGPEPGEDES